MKFDGHIETRELRDPNQEDAGIDIVGCFQIIRKT